MAKVWSLKAVPVVLAAGVILPGCWLVGPDVECDYVSGNGTVRYLLLEGGFYGIITDDGEHYDPVNLPREFQVDSLRVYFEGKVLHGIYSVHMWGSASTSIESTALSSPSCLSPWLRVPALHLCSFLAPTPRSWRPCPVWRAYDA